MKKLNRSIAAGAVTSVVRRWASVVISPVRGMKAGPPPQLCREKETCNFVAPGGSTGVVTGCDSVIETAVTRCKAPAESTTDNERYPA